MFPYLIFQSTESNFLHLATSIINMVYKWQNEYGLSIKFYINKSFMHLLIEIYNN